MIWVNNSSLWFVFIITWFFSSCSGPCVRTSQNRKDMAGLLGDSLPYQVSWQQAEAVLKKKSAGDDISLQMTPLPAGFLKKKKDTMKDIPNLEGKFCFSVRLNSKEKKLVHFKNWNWFFQNDLGRFPLSSLELTDSQPVTHFYQNPKTQSSPQFLNASFLCVLGGLQKKAPKWVLPFKVIAVPIHKNVSQSFQLEWK